MMTKKTSDITGVILVGGKSRRMGRDKAFLEVGGLPIVERVINALALCFDRLILVGDRPERFAAYHVPVCPDLYPGSALGGLYTGLFHAGTDDVFVATCDLPFPSIPLLHYLCSLREGYDAVVPVTKQGYEPLFALYSKRCLEPIREQLESGDFCAYSYYPKIRVRYVPESEFSQLCQGGRCFLNVNTPEEFAELEKEQVA